MKEKGEKKQNKTERRFVQLICKDFLIFKSNLELALSIILKKENYTSQSMLWWSVDV